VSVARPNAATTVPYASLSNDNLSMTSGLAGSTTLTALAGNAHYHGDRPNFANSRRWTPSVPSAAETSPCQCRLWRSLQLVVMAAGTGPHNPVSVGPTMTKTTTTMIKHHQSDVDDDDDAVDEKSL
jgi:hypothetical protein